MNTPTIKLPPGSLDDKVCVYCGTAPATTRDHVPPRCLFPKPTPSLVTVPACAPCNEGCSKDDVYFRDILVASANLKNEPNASRVRDTVVRSLRRPQQEGLATYIRSSFMDVDIQSPGGIFLGTGLALRVEVQRIRM